MPNELANIHGHLNLLGSVLTKRVPGLLVAIHWCLWLGINAGVRMTASFSRRLFVRRAPKGREALLITPKCVSACGKIPARWRPGTSNKEPEVVADGKGPR